MEKQAEYVQEIVDKLWTDDIQKGLVILRQGVTHLSADAIQKIKTEFEANYLDAKRPNEGYACWVKGTDYKEYFYQYHIERQAINYICNKHSIKFVIPVGEILNLQNVLNLMRGDKIDAEFKGYSISGNSLIKEYDLQPLSAYIFNKYEGFIALTSKTNAHKFYSVRKGSSLHWISARHWLDEVKKMLEKKPDEIAFEKSKIALQILIELGINEGRYWHDNIFDTLRGIELTYKYTYLPQETLDIAEKQGVLEEMQSMNGRTRRYG